MIFGKRKEQLKEEHPASVHTEMRQEEHINSEDSNNYADVFPVTYRSPVIPAPSANPSIISKVYR